MNIEHMKHKPSYHVYRDHVDKVPDLCAIKSVKKSEKFNSKLRDLVT